MRDLAGPTDADAATRARERLRAVGMGYIEFALAEPGWFRVVFFPDPPRPAGCDAQDGPRQADTQAGPPQADALAGPPAADAPPAPPEAAAPPYRALVEALDALAAAGVLSLRQRRDAEWPCWSAVHGFAELALRGPLRGRERDNLHRLASATVDAIIAGVAS